MAEGGEIVMNIVDGEWAECRRSGGDGAYFTLDVSGAQIAVVSTPGSRVVVASPELVGQRYIDQVSAATREALGSIAWERHGVPPERPHPLVVLRGGATFSPQAALEALGHQPGAQSFITSESHRPADGPSGATQRYAKFEEIEGVSTLLLCDIVATGGTAVAAVEKALSQAPSIRHLVVVGFVTVEGVTHLVEQLRGQLSVFIIAFEGVFRLPGTDDRSRLYTTPCDFRRSDIVCEPHLIRLLQDRPDLAIEQCVIYDGGERAFSPEAHLRGRASYLRHMAALTQSQRWAELRYRSGVLWDGSRVLGDPHRALIGLQRARTAVEERFQGTTVSRPTT